MSLNVKGVVLEGLIVACLCGAIFGYATGNIDYTKKSFGEHVQAMDTGDKDFLTAVILIGALIGSLLSSFLADFMGRKMTILVSTLIFTIPGNTIMVAAINYAMLVTGRFILGLSVGLYSCVGPLYLSETSSPAQRGFLGAFFQFAITFTIFVPSLFAFFDQKNIWRWVFGINFLFIVPLALYSFFIKETPRFLVRKGKIPEATELFRDIYNSEQEITEEIKTIQEKMGEVPPSWLAIFTRRTFKPLMISIFLAIGQQLTGINAIIYYATSITTKSLGLDPVKNRVIYGLIPVILMGWNCLTSMASIKIIDRVGRRTLMLIGMGIMMGCMLVSASVSFIPHKIVMSAIFTFFMAGFILGFEISVGPLFFIIINEIFPESMRGRIGSLMVAIQWLFNLVLTLTFIPINTALGSTKKNPNTYVFYIFGGIGLVCWIFYYTVLPETKDKSFDDIQKEMM